MSNEKKPKAPAFQMYASDFLTDTQEMTVCEVGAYIRLLLNQWVNGSLPDETHRLAFISGMDSKEFILAWEILKKKFVKGEDGRLKNPRLEIVRDKQNVYIQSKVISGAKGAKKRWQDPEEFKVVEERTVRLDTDVKNIKLRRNDNVKYLFEGTEFVLAWEGWLIHKKNEHKKIYKSTASEDKAILLLHKLTEGNVKYAIDCIDLSISMGWMGIYDNKELKTKYGKQQADAYTGKQPSYNPNDLSKLNQISRDSDK